MPGLPVITGDQDRLIQVVINLISNAVKFADAGSITCSAHLQMSGAGDGAGIGKLHGVRDKIDNHLNQPILIAGNDGKAGIDVADEI